MIRYSIPQRSFVTLKVYDILGKEIATLINGELNAGQFQIEFNSKNVASGIYYCQLKSGNFLKTIKMIFMK
jgi:hypothetical protein